MANERAMGDHLGYLQYHLDALDERHDEIESELKAARESANTEKERLRAKLSILKEYRGDVASRMKKLEKQAENVHEDATETTQDRADEIRESAGHTHLEDADVDQDVEFQSASEFTDN